MLDADFSDDADGQSDISNATTFTGRRYDAESGLYYYRNRVYHAEVGRFVSRDPIRYIDGGSLYRPYFVPNGVDPTGLAKDWSRGAVACVRLMLCPRIFMCSVNCDGSFQLIAVELQGGNATFNQFTCDEWDDLINEYDYQPPIA